MESLPLYLDQIHGHIGLFHYGNDGHFVLILYNGLTDMVICMVVMYVIGKTRKNLDN